MRAMYTWGINGDVFIAGYLLLLGLVGFWRSVRRRQLIREPSDAGLPPVGLRDVDHCELAMLRDGIDAMRDRLQRLGVAPTSENITRFRREGLAFVPLLVLAVARIVADVVRHNPFGFIVALAVATVIAAFVTGQLNRTKRGDALLALAEQAGVTGSDAGMAMAAGGFAAMRLADPALAIAMDWPASTEH